MLAFLITAIVLVYIFIGMVVYNVTLKLSTSKCGRNHASYYNYCNHACTSALAALFWPLLPFVYVFHTTAVALARSGKAVADRLVK